MTEYIGQAIAVLALILSVISYQMPNAKALLFVHAAVCLSMGISYIFLGSLSGAVLNILAVLRNFIYYNKNMFKGKTWVYICTAVMFLAGTSSAVFSKDVWSVLVIIGLTLNTYCLSFENAQSIRKSILFTSPFALCYNVIVLSVGGIALEILSIASAALGVIRYKKS